jgi:hypothetical protein
MRRTLYREGVDGTEVDDVPVHIASFIKAMNDEEGVDSDVDGSMTGLVARRLCCMVMRVASSIPFMRRGTQSLRASMKYEGLMASVLSDWSRNVRSNPNSMFPAGCHPGLLVIAM